MIRKELKELDMINEEWREKTIEKMAEAINKRWDDKSLNVSGVLLSQRLCAKGCATAAFQALLEQLPNTAPDSTDNDVWITEGNDSVKLIRQLIAMKD